MTILEALVKLRDDLKLWVTNNLNNKLNKNLGTDDRGKLLTIDDNGDIVATNSVNESISDLQNEVDKKANAKDLEWVSYNELLDLSIQVPNNPYKLKFDDNGISLSHGESVAIYKDDAFTSEKLVANRLFSVGDLVFIDEGDAGFSIM